MKRIIALVVATLATMVLAESNNPQTRPAKPVGPPTSWASVGVGGGGAFYNPSFGPNANELYVVTDMTEMYHSADLGTTWTVLDFRRIHRSGLGVQFTNAPLVRHAMDSHGAPAKTTDGGAAWKALAGYSGGSANALKADLANQDRVVIADDKNVYFSKDGGASFAIKFTDAAGAYVSGALFDGGNIYVGTNKGILVSSDDGATFNLSMTAGIPGTEGIISLAGAKAGNVTRFFAVTLSSNKVHAGNSGADHAAYQGVYTIDVGQGSWTRAVSGIAATDHPYFVAMALNDINIAYLGGGSIDSGPSVYKTTDGGKSWASVFKTANNQNIRTAWQGSGGDFHWDYGEYALGFAVAPFDPSHVAFTDLGGVNLTSDGGAMWKAAYVNPADLNPAGKPTPTRKTYHGNGMENTSAWWITWASPTDLFASFTDMRGIRSTDGGKGWSFRYTGHGYNTMYQAILHPTTGTLYAAVSTVHDLYQWRVYQADDAIDRGEGEVLYSNDKGASWSRLHNFAKPVVWTALDPKNPNRMYVSVVNHAGAGTAGGIYVSSDINLGASSTWTQLANPPRTEGHPFNIVVLNDGTLVCTYCCRLNATNRGAFTASSGVFVSTDGGATWIDRSDPRMNYFTRDLTLDPADPTQNTWLVGVWNAGGEAGGKGGLYRTTDRGQHWTLVPGTAIMNQVTQVAFSPLNQDEMYVTTGNTGLWYTGNAHAASPDFVQVANYPFAAPERVFFNPYNPAEVWVASFGNGLRVGVR